MHLMYYLDANGKRVYTLKVRDAETAPCLLFQLLTHELLRTFI